MSFENPDSSSADALYKGNSGRWRAKPSVALTEAEPLSAGTVVIDENRPVEAAPLVNNAGGGDGQNIAVAAENPGEDDGSSSPESTAGGKTAEMPAVMLAQAERVKQLMAEAVHLASSLDATVLQEQEIDSETLDNLKHAASVYAGANGDKLMNEQYARIGAEQWQAQLDTLEAAANEVITKLPEGTGIPEEIWQQMGEVQRALDVLEDKNALVSNSFVNAGGKMEDFSFLMTLKHQVDANQEDSFLRQQLYKHQSEADPARAVSREMADILSVLQKIEALVQPELKAETEIPAEVFERASQLGARLQKLCDQLDTMSPAELQKQQIDPGIKLNLRGWADYYSQEALHSIPELKKKVDAYNPLKAISDWEKVAEDIEGKLNPGEAKKSQIVGAVVPGEGKVLFNGERSGDMKPGGEASETDEQQDVIPADILDEARQLSAQAETLAARCLSLNNEERQKLKISVFTARRFEQLADQYSAENINKELSSMRRESKDWQDVQLKIRDLAENVVKLQLNMDELGATTATKVEDKTEAEKSNHRTAEPLKAEKSKDKSAEMSDAEIKRVEEEVGRVQEATRRLWADEVGKDVPFTAENLNQYARTADREKVRAFSDQLAKLISGDRLEDLLAAAGKPKGVEAEATKDSRVWKPLGESWSPEQKAEFDAWAASGAPKPEGPVLGPEVPKMEAAAAPDAQVEQQKSLEQAENERIAEVQHQQDLAMREIAELWKHIPTKQQQYEPMSWQDVRIYLQTHNGSLDGYRTTAWTKLEQRNKRYETLNSSKVASTVGLEKDLLDTLKQEHESLIAEINRQQPGRAGEILLQNEIAQRAEGKFYGRLGQSEHPVEFARTDNGVELNQIQDMATAAPEFMKLAGDKGQMEAIMNSLAALGPNANKADVDRLVAPLQQSSYFGFEAVKKQIDGDTKAHHDQVMAKLPNGLVIEMIRNGRNDIRAVKVHQSTQLMRPDTQLSIDDGRIQRTDVTEFDGDNLLKDKLGWSNNIEVYLTTKDTDGQDSGRLKLAHDKGQWRLVGQLKGQSIDKALSEDEIKKVRLHRGEMALLPGLSLPIDNLTDIALRYTGDRGKQVARNYNVLKTLREQAETAGQSTGKDAPKSARWLWHDQQLHDKSRGAVKQKAGEFRRWLKNA